MLFIIIIIIYSILCVFLLSRLSKIKNKSRYNKQIWTGTLNSLLFQNNIYQLQLPVTAVTYSWVSSPVPHEKKFIWIQR